MNKKEHMTVCLLSAGGKVQLLGEEQQGCRKWMKTSFRAINMIHDGDVQRCVLNFKNVASQL